MRLAIVLLAACSHAAVLKLPPGPLPVAVVLPIPGVTKPSCWLEAVPKAPEFLVAPTSETADVIDRVMIHRRDYAAMEQWAADMVVWAQQLSDCTSKLVEP